MGTEITPSSRSLPMTSVITGYPVEQGLYKVSAEQKFHFGTICRPDSRTFVYSKSAGACYTGQGAAFTKQRAISGSCSGALVIGDTKIKFASQTFAEDELIGGYISIFGNPGGIADNAECPFRKIVRNTACSTSTLTIEMDGPVNAAVSSTQFCEVYYNPYASVATVHGVDYPTFGGLANVYVSAANLCFWLQTAGPVWAAPQVALFSSGLYRDVYFRGDGSLQPLAYASNYAGAGLQYAGYMIPPGLTAGPLFMLNLLR